MTSVRLMKPSDFIRKPAVAPSAVQTQVPPPMSSSETGSEMLSLEQHHTLLADAEHKCQVALKEAQRATHDAKAEAAKMDQARTSLALTLAAMKVELEQAQVDAQRSDWRAKQAANAAIQVRYEVEQERKVATEQVEVLQQQLAAATQEVHAVNERAGEMQRRLRETVAANQQLQRELQKEADTHAIKLHQHMAAAESAQRRCEEVHNSLEAERATNAQLGCVLEQERHEAQVQAQTWEQQLRELEATTNPALASLCLCHKTRTLMEDPVVAPDGFSYERTTFWSNVENGMFTTPEGGKVAAVCVPNAALRRALQQQSQQQSQQQQQQQSQPQPQPQQLQQPQQPPSQQRPQSPVSHTVPPPTTTTTPASSATTATTTTTTATTTTTPTTTPTPAPKKKTQPAVTPWSAVAAAAKAVPLPVVIREPEPEVPACPPREKLALCKYYSCGSCRKARCEFSHGGTEHQKAVRAFRDFQMATNPVYKVKLCDNWNQTGACEYGESCLNAHGDGELVGYATQAVGRAPLGAGAPRQQLKAASVSLVELMKSGKKKRR